MKAPEWQNKEIMTLSVYQEHYKGAISMQLPFTARCCPAPIGCSITLKINTTNAFFQQDVATLISIDQLLHVSAALKRSVGLPMHLFPRGGPHAQLSPLLAVISVHGHHSHLPLQPLSKLTLVSWNRQCCQPRPCWAGIPHSQ